MSRVNIQGITKAYTQPVLKGIDLDVPEGSITAVLGPSGCGKSTLLRIVAGFIRSDAGTVTIGDRVVESPTTQVRAQRRGVGYVPQEGALFPHLTVGRNILFGLPRADRTKTRLSELLELAELDPNLAGRYPHEISGGQQQRVALARALAPKPAVILLDEPFSSLDAALRASAGRSVARVLRHAGATAILVTHDQGEALSLSDQVAVMRAGRFLQVDSPARLYDQPVDPEVAQFVGGASMLPGTVVGDVAECELGRLALAPGAVAGPARLFLRPEQLVLDAGDGVPAEVVDVDYFGAQVVVHLQLPSGVTLTARGPAARPPSTGDRVTVAVVGLARAHPPEQP